MYEFVDFGPSFVHENECLKHGVKEFIYNTLITIKLPSIFINIDNFMFCVWVMTIFWIIENNVYCLSATDSQIVSPIIWHHKQRLKIFHYDFLPFDRIQNEPEKLLSVTNIHYTEENEHKQFALETEFAFLSRPTETIEMLAIYFQKNVTTFIFSVAIAT